MAIRIAVTEGGGNIELPLKGYIKKICLPFDQRRPFLFLDISLKKIAAKSGVHLPEDLSRGKVLDVVLSSLSDDEALRVFETIGVTRGNYLAAGMQLKEYIRIKKQGKLIELHPAIYSLRQYVAWREDPAVFD